LALRDGRTMRAHRLILATGVRDLFPAVEDFETFYGRQIFTCPSCDGYEARGKAVLVLGDEDEVCVLALGLLDWASSVTMLVPPAAVARRPDHFARIARSGVSLAIGKPSRFVGVRGVLRSLHLADGAVIRCDMVFCAIEHVQQSDVPLRLGCEFTVDRSVVVDDHGRTTVPHVYAAGDMTPGPHLVQVAAAQGAVAGIHAAMSLRGEHGSWRSPKPAPRPDRVMNA
jgi:thioredoxin reductase